MRVVDRKEGRRPRLRHTVEKILAKLGRVEVTLSRGQPDAKVCQGMGITELTPDHWKNENEGSCIDQANQLKRLEEVQVRAKRLAVFLDYDGTLTPIVDQPKSATLSREMRAIITQLARQCPVTIVSGRDRMDVQKLVQVDTVVYAGCHGFDIRGPGNLRWSHGEGRTCWPVLRAAEKKLRQAFSGITSVHVERKAFMVAVHMRFVEASLMPEVRQIVEMVAKVHPRLRMTGGKHIMELRPAVDWDKGKAVGWVLKALHLGKDTVPIYIGDDETDEDAFTAVQDCGLGVRVAQTPTVTAARYTLQDPDEVKEFLIGLIDMMQTSKE